MKMKKGAGLLLASGAKAEAKQQSLSVSQTAETTDGKPGDSLSLLALSNHYQTSHVFNLKFNRPQRICSFCTVELFSPISVHVTVTIGSSASSGVARMSRNYSRPDIALDCKSEAT